jgi:hypothetical protein
MLAGKPIIWVDLDLPVALYHVGTPDWVAKQQFAGFLGVGAQDLPHHFGASPRGVVGMTKGEGVAPADPPG